MRRAQKALIVGVDSLMLGWVRRFVGEGHLPHLARLMNSGCVAATWPAFPTGSACNWATFATGADPQVHGIVQEPYEARRCQAETLWDCAARAGRRALVLNWPGVGSPDGQRPVVVGDGSARGGTCVAPEAVYSRSPLSGAASGPEPVEVVVECRPPEDWLDPPDSARPPLAVELPVPADADGKTATVHGLVLASEDRGYDRVLLATTRDASQAVAELEVGDWSDPLRLPAGDGPTVSCRFRLVELQPDASRLALFRSPVHRLSGFTDPEGVARGLVDRVGPYEPPPGRPALDDPWSDTYEERLGHHTGWLAAAAQHLMQTEEWSLCAVRCGALAPLLSELWADLDPDAPEHRATRLELAWRVAARSATRIDEMIGELVAALPEESVVAVLSDHGRVGNYRAVNVTAALERAGVLALGPEGNVDMLRSQVVPSEFAARVRLAGRDDAGIVSRDDYEGVRQAVIDALLDIRDPEGGHVIQVAVRREEAGFLGVDHPAVGDVVFALAPGFVYRPGGPQPERLVGPAQLSTPSGTAAAADTQYLPAARLGIGTMEGFCCFVGAGVKAGVTRSRPIWLRDVAPTLLHLLGLPPPAQAEGRVRTELLMGNDER